MRCGFPIALTKRLFILGVGRGDIVDLLLEIPRHIPACDVGYDAFIHDQARHLSHEVARNPVLPAADGVLAGYLHL